MTTHHTLFSCHKYTVFSQMPHALFSKNCQLKFGCAAYFLTNIGDIAVFHDMTICLLFTSGISGKLILNNNKTHTY